MKEEEEEEEMVEEMEEEAEGEEEEEVLMQCFYKYSKHSGIRDEGGWGWIYVEGWTELYLFIWLASLYITSSLFFKRWFHQSSTINVNIVENSYCASTTDLLLWFGCKIVFGNFPLLISWNLQVFLFGDDIKIFICCIFYACLGLILTLTMTVVSCKEYGKPYTNLPHRRV